MNRQEVAIWQKQNIGVTPNGEIRWGATCETCGLSEWGVQRLLWNGFSVNSCVRCPDAVRRMIENA